jgi:hypothetical protein
MTAVAKRKNLDDCSPSQRVQFSPRRNKRKFLWKLTISISDGAKQKSAAAEAAALVEDCRFRT